MKFEKIYLYVLIFMVSFWIPFPKLSSPSIAVFGLLVIYGTWKEYLKFQFNWILFCFFSLYLLYSLYCIPSQHMDKAMNYLEYKLSFLVFPILFSFRPIFQVDRRALLQSFVLACLTLSIFIVSQASYHYIQTRDLTYFQSSAFSTVHHPSYFAAFLSFSIYILIQEFRVEVKPFKKYTYLAIIVFFSLLHFPLASLAGILLLFVLYAFLFTSWAWKKLKRWQFASMIVLGILSIQMMLFIQPSLKSNISYTMELVEDYMHSPSEYIKESPKGMSGNQARLVIWTITGQIISEQPMGVGLGNLEDRMKWKLAQLNQDELIEKNYNPHNQFLQLTAEIGVFGFLWIMVLLSLTIRLAWKRKDDLLLFLIFSLLLNSMFESMLQRQSGIVFYTMFICLFVQIIRIPKTKLT